MFILLNEVTVGILCLSIAQYSSGTGPFEIQTFVTHLSHKLFENNFTKIMEQDLVLILLFQKIM